MQDMAGQLGTLLHVGRMKLIVLRLKSTHLRSCGWDLARPAATDAALTDITLCPTSSLQARCKGSCFANPMHKESFPAPACWEAPLQARRRCQRMSKLTADTGSKML